MPEFILLQLVEFCFFFNDACATEIYTLSLHDALPILLIKLLPILGTISGKTVKLMVLALPSFQKRSEERFSRNAETDLVCRLLLEKKKTAQSRRSNVTSGPQAIHRLVCGQPGLTPHRQ